MTTHIPIQVHIHSYTHTYAYTHTYSQDHIHTCPHRHIHSQVPTGPHIHECPHRHTLTHTHGATHTHLPTKAHTYTHQSEGTCFASFLPGGPVILLRLFPCYFLTSSPDSRALMRQSISKTFSFHLNMFTNCMMRSKLAPFLSKHWQMRIFVT